MRFIQRTSFFLRRFMSNDTCNGSGCNKFPQKIFTVDEKYKMTDKNINYAIMDTLVYQTEEIKYMKLELMRLNEKINNISNKYPCIKDK